MVNVSAPAVSGPVSVTVPAVPENCAKLLFVHVVSAEPLTYQSTAELVQLPVPPPPVPDFCPAASQYSVIWAMPECGHARKVARSKYEMESRRCFFINYSIEDRRRSHKRSQPRFMVVKNPCFAAICLPYVYRVLSWFDVTVI